MNLAFIQCTTYANFHNYAKMPPYIAIFMIQLLNLKFIPTTPYFIFNCLTKAYIIIFSQEAK